MGVGNILSNNMSVKIRLEKFLKDYISNSLGQASLAEVMSDVGSESKVKRDFMSSIFEILKEHSYKILVQIKSDDLDIPSKYLSREYIENAHNEMFIFLLNNITRVIHGSYIKLENRPKGCSQCPIDITKVINNITSGADDILDKAVNDFKKDIIIEYAAKHFLDDVVTHVKHRLSNQESNAGAAAVADHNSLVFAKLMAGSNVAGEVKGSTFGKGGHRSHPSANAGEGMCWSGMADMAALMFKR